MQSGDSGAREYIDRMVTSSSFAREIAEKDVTSPEVFYNRAFLHAEHNEGSMRRDVQKKGKLPYATFDASTNPNPWDGFDPKRKSEKKPEKVSAPVEGDDEGGLFDDIDTDDRVDCLGNPLALGSDYAYTKCARACAGLCGDPSGYTIKDFVTCEHFVYSTDNGSDLLDKLGEIPPTQGVGEVYRSYGDRIIARREEIQEKFLGNIPLNPRNET